MKKYNVLCFAVVMELLLSVLIISSATVSAVSPKAPYIHMHCNINTSYIENNLCEDDNCRIFDGTDTNFVLEIWGNLSDNATELLNQACDPDITPVINYIEENNMTTHITIDYNDFYPYYPTGENLDLKNIKLIGDTWYLVSSSFDPESVLSFYRATELMFILIIVILTLIIIIVISIILYERWKKRNKSKQL